MTVLAIVTLCDGDCDLFPFWLEHYRGLGVDRFVVCVDFEHCPPHVFDYHKWEGGNVHFWRYRGARDGAERDSEERLAIEQAEDLFSKPDWILYTDLDEHQEYQGGLHEALAKADAAGEEIVMGVHVDRLAADGSFPPLPRHRKTDEGEGRCQRCGRTCSIDREVCYACRNTTALQNTYPLRANLSRDVLKIRYTKVMAAKPGVFVRPGRHGTKEHAFAGKRAGILDTGHLVHHFKWRAGILERIRARMKSLPPAYDWYRDKYGPFVAAVEANGGRILPWMLHNPCFRCGKSGDWDRNKEVKCISCCVCLRPVGSQPIETQEAMA